METLWPDVEPAKAAGRLSVAMSVVRAVLDPGRREEPDHHLIADRDTVALDHLTVDVHTFLATTADAFAAQMAGDSRRATGLFSQAERLYAGDFLAEDPYEDWAVPRREEARATAIAVLFALVEDGLRQQAWDRAIPRLHRILDIDPHDEGAHLKLVAALSEAGRYAEAHRRYIVYAQRMDELGVEAAPKPVTVR